jgi:hypothetical protein
MKRRNFILCLIIPLLFAVSQAACQRVPVTVTGVSDPNGSITNRPTPSPTVVLKDCTGPSQDVNSECVTPTSTEYAALPTELTPSACTESSVRLEYTSYPGRVSPDLVPVIIYLPPCYDDLDRRFPVLYLLHGQPQGENAPPTRAVV